MLLLDPFYGVGDFGRNLAKWMNRLLLLAELAVVCYGVYYMVDDYCEWWAFLLYAPLSLLAICILNKIVRVFWNIVEVIVYGTTDTQELQLDYELRQEKKANRKMQREIAAYVKQARTPLCVNEQNAVSYLPVSQTIRPDNEPDVIEID